MKKILTIALCGLAAVSVSAQEANVKAAKKLVGKIDKVEEARAAIGQAIANPETANNPETYFIAGKIEFGALDEAKIKEQFNPKDAVDPMRKAEWALRGYQNMIKVLPLDSNPNEKGQIKPKFSKDVIAQINAHHADYSGAGGEFYNNKMYPEAYEAFLIYGTLPKSPYATKIVAATPDTIINQNLFYAGLSAYAAEQLRNAATAFSLARANNSDNLDNYIYEIACWQNLMRTDSTAVDEARAAIEEISMDGIQKFGNKNSVFISNIVDSKVAEGKPMDAMKVVDDMIAANGETASLVSLQAFINDRMGNNDAAVAAYKKAINMSDVDADILKRAAAKLYKVGVEKNNELNPNDTAGKSTVKNEYFVIAQNAINKAKELKPSDGDLDQIKDAIDYAIETYFSNVN